MFTVRPVVCGPVTAHRRVLLARPTQRAEVGTKALLDSYGQVRAGCVAVAERNELYSRFKPDIYSTSYGLLRRTTDSTIL